MFERLLKIFLPVAFGVALQTVSAGALSVSAAPAVVIAQVQAGSTSGSGAATQEFISIYNNSDTPVDVTGWCVSNKANVKFACLKTDDVATNLILVAHGYALIASKPFAERYPGSYDVSFDVTNGTSGSLVGGGDSITLLDADGTVVDTMNWTSSLPGGSVLTRQWANEAAGFMLDTNSIDDFKKLTSLIVPPSAVVEETHVIDVCPNIEGVQPQVPAGYGIAGGTCILDVCPNIGGLQLVLPARMKIDQRGYCMLDVPLLLVTELLPNAAGTDESNEFIELYNPNDSPVDLSMYKLQIGQNFEKSYAFGAGETIEPLSYKAFYNDAIAFSLLNTASRVRIVSHDDQIISESPMYTNPAENEAWAFIDDAWMFTNQPSPGAENLLSVQTDTSAEAVVVSSLKPCASNQYRSPETNRCRLVSTSTGDVKPCKNGQYRSEETNRCRSIVSDVSEAKACAENQFRNPDSGRCKRIASEEELKDCGEGRERNPLTGRCRNVAAKAGGTTSGGVSMVAAPAASVMGWWAVGIVGFIALGYGILEWRREIRRRIAPVIEPFIRAFTAIKGTLLRLRYNKRI